MGQLVLCVQGVLCARIVMSSFELCSLPAVFAEEPFFCET